MRFSYCLVHSSLIFCFPSTVNSQLRKIEHFSFHFLVIYTRNICNFFSHLIQDLLIVPSAQLDHAALLWGEGFITNCKCRMSVEGEGFSSDFLSQIHLLVEGGKRKSGSEDWVFLPPHLIFILQKHIAFSMK